VTLHQHTIFSRKKNAEGRKKKYSHVGHTMKNKKLPQGVPLSRNKYFLENKKTPSNLPHEMKLFYMRKPLWTSYLKSNYNLPLSSQSISDISQIDSNLMSYKHLLPYSAVKNCVRYLPTTHNHTTDPCFSGKHDSVINKAPLFPL
jgi:hypothetical protein